MPSIDKAEQLDNIRRALAEVEADKAVGVFVFISEDEDGDSVMSVCTANLDPEHAAEALKQAYSIVLTDNDLH